MHQGIVGHQERIAAARLPSMMSSQVGRGNDGKLLRLVPSSPFLASVTIKLVP